MFEVGYLKESFLSFISQLGIWVVKCFLMRVDGSIFLPNQPLKWGPGSSEVGKGNGSWPDTTSSTVLTGK